MVASMQGVRLCKHLFGEVIAGTEMGGWAKDAKTELQEWLQARRLPVPTYRISRHAWPGPCPDLRGRVRGTGPGPESKRAKDARGGKQSRRRRASMLEGLKASDRPGGPLRS